MPDVIESQLSERRAASRISGEDFHVACPVAGVENPDRRRLSRRGGARAYAEDENGKPDRKDRANAHRSEDRGQDLALQSTSADGISGWKNRVSRSNDAQASVTFEFAATSLPGMIQALSLLRETEDDRQLV
jgi:hypothetical protein